MPTDDGMMNADDFRQDASEGEGGTIHDPLQDGQASSDSSLQQDPSLKDFASQTSTRPDSAQRDADAGDDRYRHMQSRADKAQRLADERAQQIADLQAQIRLQQPIIEMLQTDEEVQQVVNARLGGQPRPQGIVPPKPPEQPADYNEAEAYTNPQSESYRFRKANEKFLRDRQDYLEALYRQQQEFQVQQQRQLQQRQMEAQRMREVQAELINDFQLTPTEAQEFLSDMTSKDSVSTENLVRYWRFLKANPVRRQGAPPPPAGGGGPGRGQAPDPNEMFNRHIREVAASRRR